MNVAEFHGETATAGSVQVGRRADLLLLDANPLEDIRNSQRISGVVVAGRWISPAERAQRLQSLVMP
jgi:imidazolonepropionase-like amidohydrolase